MRITWVELGQRARQHRALPDGKGWDLAGGRGVSSDRRSARGLLTHALTLVSPVLNRDDPDSRPRPFTGWGDPARADQPGSRPALRPRASRPLCLCPRSPAPEAGGRAPLPQPRPLGPRRFVSAPRAGRRALRLAPPHPRARRTWRGGGGGERGGGRADQRTPAGSLGGVFQPWA